MFSVKQCTRCHLAITPSELVMRARDFVYHLHCFTCATCNKSFTKGEYFGLKNDVIYCRHHYELLIQYIYPYGSQNNDLSTATRCPPEYNQPVVYEDIVTNSSSCPSNGQEINGLGIACHASNTESSVVSCAPTKGRPRKRKVGSLIINRGSTAYNSTEGACGMISSQDTPLGVFQHTTSSPLSTGRNTTETRPKRMRTSFKHHQVRTMKSYFATNHNPDAKDLKQLSQKTGLSKRVLQVWFQNARAKWRRNLLRQQAQGPEVVQDSKPLTEMTPQETLFGAQRSSLNLTEMHPTQIMKEEQNASSYTMLL